MCIIITSVYMKKVTVGPDQPVIPGQHCFKLVSPHQQGILFVALCILIVWAAFVSFLLLHTKLVCHTQLYINVEWYFALHSACLSIKLDLSFLRVQFEHVSIAPFQILIHL